MSNTIIKLRLPSGNLAVYDVQPQHRGQPETVRAYGAHLFTQFNGQWVDVRAGHGREVTADVAQVLSGLPLELDTAPGTWGVQAWVPQESGAGYWTFLAPAGGVPFRYDAQDAAERALTPLIRLDGDAERYRVARFGDAITEPQLRADYYSADGAPKRCRHCGSRDIGRIVEDSVSNISCEERHSCNNCGMVIGFWSYGAFEPGFALDLPEAVSG